jgi:hypothetical protein
MAEIWYLVTSFIYVPHIVGSVFWPVRFLLPVCRRAGGFTYLICLYMRRLTIQNLLKCMGDTPDFYRSASKSDLYYCDLFIELIELFTCRQVWTLIPLQFKNILRTIHVVVLFHCCNLIWGLTNNNYSLYLLQFWLSVSIYICAIFAFPSYI